MTQAVEDFFLYLVRKYKKTEDSETCLKGLSFSSGNLGWLSPDEVKALILRFGGSFHDNLTKETDFLIFGAETGCSILNKAKDFSIVRLYETAFLSLIAFKLQAFGNFFERLKFYDYSRSYDPNTELLACSRFDFFDGYTEIQISALFGKNCFLTGSFSMKYKRISKLLIKLQGFFSCKLDAKVDYIIHGNNPNAAHMAKAKGLGIVFLSESEFLKLSKELKTFKYLTPII